MANQNKKVKNNGSASSNSFATNNALSSNRDPSLFDPEREVSISTKGSITSNNNSANNPEFDYPDLTFRPPSPSPLAKKVQQFESEWVKTEEKPYDPIEVPVNLSRWKTSNPPQISQSRRRDEEIPTQANRNTRDKAEKEWVKTEEKPFDPIVVDVNLSRWERSNPPPSRAEQKPSLSSLMEEIQLANESDELAPQYSHFTPAQTREADTIIRKIIDEFSSILRPMYSKANKGYNPTFDVKTLLEEYQKKIWSVRKSILLKSKYPDGESKFKSKPTEPVRNADSAYRMKISKNPIFAKIRRGNDDVDQRLSDIDKAYDRISEEYKAKFEKEKEKIEEWGQSEKEKIVAKYDLKRDELEQYPKSESKKKARTRTY
jgi:hypothetical protein